MCLLISAGLHVGVLALLWGWNIVPPPPIHVVLVSPKRAPGESFAPRADAPDAPGRPGRPGARSPGPAEPHGPPPTPDSSDEGFITAPRASRLEPHALLVPRLHLDLPDLEAGGTDAASQPTAAGGDAAQERRYGGDASAYGPGDARLSLLLRADRIRGTRYVDDVRRALAPFPDDRMLRERAGLDPLVDFDSILIASADPFDFNATFLAARYSFPEKRLRQAFARAAGREGHALAWRTQAGRPVASLPIRGPDGRTMDPRALVLVRDGVAVLTRPEHVAAIAAAVVPDGGVAGPAAGDWPGRISLLEAETGGDPDGPALLLTLHDVRGYVFAAPGETLPIPHTARMTISNLRTEPTVTFDFAYDTPAQAASFVQQWTPRARAIAGSTMIFLLGLSDLALRFQVQANGLNVRAHAVVHPAELQQILRLIAQIGPRPAASQPTSQPATQPASQPASGPAPPAARRGSRP